MLTMTLNVDVEKATAVEMPAIRKGNDEFAVVHSNPEWYNGTPTHSTPVSDCMQHSTASRSPLLC